MTESSEGGEKQANTGKARASIDWEAVECDYRAGILSVREIGKARGVSHVMVGKKAKSLGWVRDLKARIQAKADALVNAATVTGPVTSERALVDGNAQTVANVRISHRTDITRFRSLVVHLLAECEAEAADPGLFAELGEMLRTPDDRGQDRLNEVYQKVISLPQRIKGVKDLADTMKTLIGLEREAYGITPVPEVPLAQQLDDPMYTARWVAFTLASALKQEVML